MSATATSVDSIPARKTSSANSLWADAYRRLKRNKMAVVCF
ncbi:MAG: hypothetical protein KDD61_01800, partial [Bdellovibrionales bacterium]|nr:hypothetical protein [Bdellovibrionales bacterium]